MTQAKKKPSSTSTRSQRHARAGSQNSHEDVAAEQAGTAVVSGIVLPMSKSQRTEVIDSTSTEPQPASAQQQLMRLLLCDEGATIDQMVSATGWKPHSVRAAMTGFRKKGYVIDSDKLDAVRTYRAVAPE